VKKRVDYEEGKLKRRAVLMNKNMKLCRDEKKQKELNEKAEMKLRDEISYFMGQKTKLEAKCKSLLDKMAELTNEMDTEEREYTEMMNDIEKTRLRWMKIKNRKLMRCRGLIFQLDLKRSLYDMEAREFMVTKSKEGDTLKAKICSTFKGLFAASKTTTIGKIFPGMKVEFKVFAIEDCNEDKKLVTNDTMITWGIQQAHGTREIKIKNMRLETDAVSMIH